MKKNIKIKKFHPKAKIPVYYEDAAGMDFYATRKTWIVKHWTENGIIEKEVLELTSGMIIIGIKYYLGVGVQLPKNCALQIMPRSSIYKKDLILSNSPGLIDPDYRGEISAIFKFLAPISYIAEDYTIFSHDATDEVKYYQTLEENIDAPAVCQGMIVDFHRAVFEEVDELEKTKRGTGGFGSSDGSAVIPGTNKGL